MKNNNVTTQDLLDMAQKELLSRDEIMVRLGIYSVPTYYQFINKIFDGMTSSKVYFFKVVHENVIRKKHEQKPRIELTTKDFPFLTFELNQMLKQGYTQIEIMNKYDIPSKYEFWNICKNLYAGNAKSISTLKQKLALNLQKKLLELSEKISQEEIAVFLKIKLSSFKTIKRQFFLDQEAYQIFNNNLKNFKKNKATIKVKDENVKKNPLESDIAIIYHANYLNSLSSDELIKELNSESFSIAIIPQSFLRKVSSNYTAEYSKVFSIIIDGISSGRFIIDNFKAISTQEGSEIRTIDKESFKLAFSFIQKGYTPIIKSNNVITLVNAISLGIKVAHTNTHKNEIKNNNQTSPVDINYAISYDADYLASHMESFQGKQPKIIFSFVLNDLIRKHCNSILYHIIDCIQDKENNIQIIYTDRNNMLFKLLRYKLENNVHIILKTTNPSLRKDAINLGLLVNNTDFTQNEVKTKNIIQFNSLFSKNKTLDFIFRDGNYYVESSINFTVLDKEKQKKAFATVFDGKIYYKVEKGYYIKYKNGLIYKVSSFNKEDNLILAM